MQFLGAVLHRCRWLHISGVVLIALLQRSPALRLVGVIHERMLVAPGCAMLRSAVVSLASLGSAHALAGATQFVLSRPSPISDVVGAEIAPVFFTYTGTPAAPRSFRITGELPPGLAFLPPATAGGIVNANTPFIRGIPTSVGTYTIRVQGYNNVDGTGETNNEQVPIVFNITAGAATAPFFTQQPSPQSVVAGGNVTFTVTAGGSPPPTFQWRRNSTNIAGATNASLTLSNVQPSDAGDYSVVIANSAGNLPSNNAALVVTPPVNSNARLSNLSVRTALAASQTLIVGIVVKDGARNVLVRAAGPALATFGLPSTMSDPLLELYDERPAMVFANNDWPASLVPMFTSVGAFGFPDNSKDAAFVREINGAYSIQARGTGPGVVLVEAYDTGAPTTARLVNVSARNRVGVNDDILIAGFTLTGTGGKQLLIRAVGPKLAAFGVVGALVDPKFEVYNSAGAKVAENDNWNANLASTFVGVGAFALDSGSRDAALAVVLQPGGYTVQVRGADGGTGEALIELYELQ
jgi:hypothetical protein